MKLMQTYVYRKDECFFVSTMRRQSLAPWYAETIAWRTHPDPGKGYSEGPARGDVVAQAAEGPALVQHMDVVKQLFETGVYNERE